MKRESLGGLARDFLFDLAEKVLSTLSMVLTEAVRVIVIGLVLLATESFLQVFFPITLFRTIIENVSFLFLIVLWFVLVIRDIVREIGYARREYEETKIFLAPGVSRTLAIDEPTPVLRPKRESDDDYIQPS